MCWKCFQSITVAFMVGGIGFEYPHILRSAGKTKRWQVTVADTGFPGNPNTKRFSSIKLHVANVVGFLKRVKAIFHNRDNTIDLRQLKSKFYPGFMLIRPKCSVAFRSVVSMLFSKSLSPIETPPVVTTTSAQLRLFCKASSKACGLKTKNSNNFQAGLRWHTMS